MDSAGRRADASKPWPRQCRAEPQAVARPCCPRPARALLAASLRLLCFSALPQEALAVVAGLPAGIATDSCTALRPDLRRRPLPSGFCCGGVGTSSVAASSEPGAAAPAFPCSHSLGHISAISFPFFLVFCAFSPPRRDGSNEPQAGTQGSVAASPEA
eukprot:COSAG04_NODE_10530_length_770_cov_3.111773_1_plen_157_part_10